MNKGLEVIEAHHLFGVAYDRIGVVVHPQSIVHSLIDLNDGASLAHMGHPDMRVPISYALHHPDRVDVPVRALSLAEVGSLTFEEPDERTFRCLRLAREAGEAGGTAPCVLNAANEVAVHAFLDGRAALLRASPTWWSARSSALPAQPLRHFNDLYDGRRRSPRARTRDRGGRSRSRELAAGVRGLCPAGDPARAGPLLRGQGGGHAGGEVLAVLPAHAGLQEGGRDRVRDRRHPRGRLREDHRDEPRRGAASGGSRPRLPRAAGVEADRGDPRRAGREPRPGAGAAVHLLRGNRAAHRDRPRSGTIEKELSSREDGSSQAIASCPWTASAGSPARLSRADRHPRVRRRLQARPLRGARAGASWWWSATASGSPLVAHPDLRRPGEIDLGWASATPRARARRCRWASRAEVSLDQFWFITKATVSLPARLFDAEQRKEISGIVGSYEVTRQTILNDHRRGGRDPRGRSRCRWRS